jgi:hypothetical protein
MLHGNVSTGFKEKAYVGAISLGIALHKLFLWNF